MCVAGGSCIIGVGERGVAGGIVVDSIDKRKLVSQGVVIARQGVIAMYAAVVSILVKELLYWYTIAVANRYKSPVARANAWHHRSDAFSSIGTLIGISGAYFLGEKWRVLDPIAAIFVSVLIAKVAFDLIRAGVNELLERSLSAEEESDIERIVLSDATFTDMHNLKTRRIGSGIAVELHVRVSGEMSVSESHAATKEADKIIKQ